ncbi:MAG: hypothetical protein QGG64_00050 [Candidatus Latescibacteria bacterium]|jgi:hypothetical protein|nr:hypothetical protein [Candidatus Latescibacterota bacterium]
MLLRIILIGILIGATVRFVGRLFRALFARPSVANSPPKSPSRDLDDSQIQDADFKDL